MLGTADVGPTGGALPGPLFSVEGPRLEEEEMTYVRRPECIHRLAFGAPLHPSFVDATLERLWIGRRIAPVKTAANDPVNTSVTEFHRGDTNNGVLLERLSGSQKSGPKGANRPLLLNHPLIVPISAKCIEYSWSPPTNSPQGKCG
jgi:hypothetical protein